MLAKPQAIAPDMKQTILDEIWSIYKYSKEANVFVKQATELMAETYVKLIRKGEEKDGLQGIEWKVVEADSNKLSYVAELGAKYFRQIIKAKTAAEKERQELAARKKEAEAAALQEITESPGNSADTKSSADSSAEMSPEAPAFSPETVQSFDALLDEVPLSAYTSSFSAASAGNELLYKDIIDESK